MKVMYMLKGCASKPSLKEVMEKLCLHESDIDQDFGVEEIDVSKGDYCILVDEAAVESIGKGEKKMGD